MLAEYFPILLFLLVGIAVGVAPMVLGKLLGPNHPEALRAKAAVSYDLGNRAEAIRLMRAGIGRLSAGLLPLGRPGAGPHHPRSG